MLKQLVLIAVVFVACSAETDCSGTPDSVRQEQAAQEQITARATDAVGMPGIQKFAEKRMMKTILELRDKEINTWTYLVDLNGHLHFLCNSVGFGLPYATQYTNPQQAIRSGSEGIATVAQADPNGLYSPAAADGTWVLCLNPETKLASPLYVEPRIIVSPFKIASTN